MTLKKVFLFPGQGSQYYNMGKQLYRENMRFRTWMNYCDELISSKLNLSIIDEIYNSLNTKKPFDRIVLTNPALFSVEYCLAKVLIETGVIPDQLLGYSLGEFVSLAVSEAMSLEDGLDSIIEFSTLLESNAEEGGMLAVLSNVDIFYGAYRSAFKDVWLAGTNFNEHFVVAGRSQDITKLKIILDEAGIITNQLAVKYGFHSPLMDEMEKGFISIYDKVKFSLPKIPLYSCVKCEYIERVTAQHLWRVIREPIMFNKSIIEITKTSDIDFIDVGPTGTLSTFVKYILPKNSSSKFMYTMTEFGEDVDTFERVSRKLAAQN